MSENNNSSAPLAVGIILAIAVVGGGFIILNLRPATSEVTDSVVFVSSTSSVSSSSSVAVSQNSSTSTQTSSTAQLISRYKNGSYSTKTSYQRPGGVQQFTINISLENDVITSVNTTTTGGEAQSQQYVERFNNGISAKVVGKKIDEVSSSNLGIVSGASLTTNSFLNALGTIKNTAK